MIDHTHAGTPRAHARYDLLAGDVPVIRQAVQKRVKRPLLHCNETFASLLDFLHKLITICVFFTQQKLGIIVLVVKRRGFFGHVFRFGFNGQYRKQIEQTGTVILTEMFLKKKRPAKHLAK